MKCRCRFFKNNKVCAIKENDVNYSLDCTMYNGKHVIPYKDWLNKQDILDFDFDSYMKTTPCEVNEYRT